MAFAKIDERAQPPKGKSEKLIDDALNSHIKFFILMIMAWNFSWFLLLVVVLASVFKISSSIVLCDEGCRNAGDLGICEKVTGKIPLYLMGFFPCNSGDFRARGLTVAGQMAARAVRMNSSILQDYRLEISFSNSMVKI